MTKPKVIWIFLLCYLLGILCFVFRFVIFVFGHTAQLLGSYFPDQELNLVKILDHQEIPCNQFEFIFVKEMDSVYLDCCFFFLHVDVWYMEMVSAPFAEKAVCSILLLLLLYQRWVDCIYKHLFLGFLFWSIDLFVSSFTVLQHLDYCNFRLSLKVK